MSCKIYKNNLLNLSCHVAKPRVNELVLTMLTFKKADEEQSYMGQDSLQPERRSPKDTYFVTRFNIPQIKDNAIGKYR